MISPETLPQDPSRLDRRILRTRKALRAAMLALIKEKGFDEISVEEITEKANLGRTTFYLHYKDKEDLLLEEFREIASNRVRALSEIPFSIWKASKDDMDSPENEQIAMPLLMVFEHARQNIDLYRILFNGQNSDRLARQLREIIVQSINAIILTREQEEDIPGKTEIPADFLASYFSGALISSINWWIEQEEPPAPFEMARMFQQLFIPGVLRVWIPGSR